jgi:hypothetical protein
MIPNLEYALEKPQSGRCRKQLYQRVYESLLLDIFHDSIIPSSILTFQKIVTTPAYLWYAANATRHSRLIQTT